MGRLIVVLGLVLSAGLGCGQGTKPIYPGSIACSAADGGVLPSVTGSCQVSVDFGSVVVGKQLAAEIEITNLGSLPLNFGVVTGTLDPAFSVTAPTAPVPAGGSILLPVIYAPSSPGMNSSDVTIPTNPGAIAASPAIALQLTGQGFASSLSVDAGSLEFGNVVINSSETLNVTLTNTSLAELDGIGYQITGQTTGFTATGVPASLGAGDSATVSVTFSPLVPAVPGAATLTFSSGTASASVGLVATALAQALSLSTTTVDFKFVPPNTTLVGCTTVTNQSILAVHLQSVSGLADAQGTFRVATTDDASPPNPISYPITVPGGQSAKVCFSFNPTLMQNYAGEATLVTDDPGGQDRDIQLTGWGGGPQISCTPPSLDFGNILQGASATLPVTCSNSGTSSALINLTLGQLSVGPSAFSAMFDPAHPYSAAGIGPGESVVIDVTFDSSVDSPDTGTLVVPNNGGQGAPVQIALSAAVLDTACAFTIVPPALNFGNSPSGRSPVTLAFEIQNTGSVPCSISYPTIEGSGSTAFDVSSLSIAPDPETQIITLPVPGGDSSPNLDVGIAFLPGGAATYDAKATFSILDASPAAQSVALTATRQPSCLVVAPSSLDFGTLPFPGGATCANVGSLSFTVFNQCVTLVNVSAVTLQSGPGDVMAQFTNPAGVPPPVPLFPGSGSGRTETSYSVEFEPTTAGFHSGQVLVSDGSASALVALSGTALAASSQTDRFVVAPPKVDVLFLIDTSQQESSVLGPLFDGGLAAFVEAGTQVDYRIAVTTDDDDPSLGEAELGRLLPCPGCSVPGSTPQIISPPMALDGGGSTNPGRALTNLVRSIPIPLTNACDLFQSLLLAVEPAPLRNVDFFRPDATLAVITVSAGDDTSPLLLGWYQAFFGSDFTPSPLSWNYVSDGDANGTGFLSSTDQPSRVRQMITATGGIAVNSADPPWVGALATVWSNAISGFQYRLSAIPLGGQSAIAISDNGADVPQTGTNGSNWTYSAATNSITFAPGQAPPNGDSLAITYPIGCQ